MEETKCLNPFRSFGRADHGALVAMDDEKTDDVACRWHLNSNQPNRLACGLHRTLTINLFS
jgi:hypothetical protein